MTDESRALSPVSFPRQERHGVLLGLQWYQLLFAGAGVLAACVASASGGPQRLFWTSPLWLSLLFLGFLQYDRIPYPVWILTAARFVARIATHQTTFLATTETPVATGSLVLPGGLSSLTIHKTAEGWCFVVDSEAREAFAVMRCRATAFALLEDEDKAYAVQEWSRVQANLAKRPGVARIAIQDYTVQFPASALGEYYSRRVAARNSTSPSTEWGDRSYKDLVSAAGAASSHDILVTLVLDTARARRRIRDAGGGVTGTEQTMRSELEALATGLNTHGVKVEEWLSDRQFAEVFRGAFDPSSPVVIGKRKDAFKGMDPAQSGPMGMEEHWTHLRTDTGFHQTFWVAGWPRQKVFPGFLHPLVYVGGFRHTITQVLRAVPTDRALKDIRSAQEAHETRRRINAKFDRPTTREQLAEEQEVQQREEEIVAGHGDVRQAAYVTITAATLEELSRCRQELESAAASAFVDVRLLVGQQWAAFIAGALPLGRGLK